jgi:hypothetical protein
LTATPLDRFAVLSDIHGNLSALEAVLAGIASRSVSQIVNPGDHLQGPLDPVGTAERLIKLDLPASAATVIVISLKPAPSPLPAAPSPQTAQS